MADGTVGIAKRRGLAGALRFDRMGGSFSLGFEAGSHSGKADVQRRVAVVFAGNHFVSGSGI